jgi:hypothetical protein
MLRLLSVTKLAISSLDGDLRHARTVLPRMNYELSDHVEQEMTRRGIPLAVVEAVLAAPQQKMPEHGDVMCY